MKKTGDGTRPHVFDERVIRIQAPHFVEPWESQPDNDEKYVDKSLAISVSVARYYMGPSDS